MTEPTQPFGFGLPDWHVTNPDHTPYEDEEEIEEEEED